MGFQTSKAVPIVQGLNKNTLNQVKNKELVIGSWHLLRNCTVVRIDGDGSLLPLDRNWRLFLRSWLSAATKFSLTNRLIFRENPQFYTKIVVVGYCDRITLHLYDFIQMSFLIKNKNQDFTIVLYCILEYFTNNLKSVRFHCDFLWMTVWGVW